MPESSLRAAWPAAPASEYLKRTVVSALAAFAGLASQQGLPGSVVSLVLAGLFLLIVLMPRSAVRVPILPTIIALGSILAVLIEPGPFNLTISWLSLGFFALARQGNRFTDLAGVIGGLVHRLIRGPGREFARYRDHRQRWQSSASTRRGFDFRPLVLPATSLAVFGLLLIAANPLIEATAMRLSLDPVWNLLFSCAPLAGVLALLAIRTILSLRDAAAVSLPVDTEAPRWHAQYFAPATVALTLFLLNGLFLMQNILDFLHIWEGVALPLGYTHAEYVHRGSYALIVAALAAAALVILALWPGSRSESARTVRLLVYLWLGQTVPLLPPPSTAPWPTSMPMA